MWAGAAATGSPMPGLPTTTPAITTTRITAAHVLNADVAERLVVEILVQDVGPHIADGVAILCGPSGINKAPLLAEKVYDILKHDDDVAKAARAICESSSAATVACFRTRIVDEWARRHSDLVRCLPALTAMCASNRSALVTLLDVATAARRCRRMRRCALYAIHAISAASTNTPPTPFGTLNLDALEFWARRRQAEAPNVPAFALDIGACRAPTDRILPVVLDAVPLVRMTHNQMVAAIADGCFSGEGAPGPAASLYRVPSTATMPSEASAIQSVNGTLTLAFLQAMMLSDSAPDASFASINETIDIFAAYPGTRVGVCRHVRDIVASATADIGVFLAF